MEGADASRSNGASPEARDARSPPGTNGSLENGTKADSKDTKTTNGHSGEVTEGKTLGSALKSGEGKSALFSSNEWRRPIIQFVESVDDKGSNYFSMDSAEGRRSPYAGLQLGASKKPPVSFAEKGELRKSIFSEPRKPTVTIVEPGEVRRNSYPRADSSLLLRSKSGSEEVLCDSCIGNKQKAVKSCLVCQASFCELHLKPHLEGAAFRDHQLLEPIRDFEARKCPLHGKTMELFCQTDQTCICYLCMFQEHKNHSTVTVEEAKAEKEAAGPGATDARMKRLIPVSTFVQPEGCEEAEGSFNFHISPQTELSLQKEQLQLKIIEVEDEAEKWQKEKDRIKSFTTNEKAILEQSFRDLVRDLEKQKEEVRAALEQREQDAVDQVKVIVDALDERAKVLHEDKQTREQLHSISDSVLFLQEFGALMSNYSLPPPLPTYHVLLEGEGLGQSLGNFKDDLLNVCMRHVEKMCKADLSRNFIERNHMENGFLFLSKATTAAKSSGSGLKKEHLHLYRTNLAGESLGGDHRYMNSYTSSFGNEWSTPDTMKRYSMYLTPKGEGEYATNGRGPKSLSDRFFLGGRTSYQPSSPSRLSKETNQKNFNNLYGTKGYPSLLRSQAPKAQPQTWKSGKQTLLSHYRPFYVNKGNGMGSNEAP
ncbi:hypothetical protein ACRRTK_003861 [Alexandromys fortis]